MPATASWYWHTTNRAALLVGLKACQLGAVQHPVEGVGQQGLPLNALHSGLGVLSHLLSDLSISTLQKSR